ncbi:kinesin-like protein KIF18A isoform X2 [Zophobas morio]|uniref:kinesin-like protein KIF18A isoform X2 n=1 Tax=Zophobas morio TaxID=2755281 RepID=UPI0030828ACD
MLAAKNFVVTVRVRPLNDFEIKTGRPPVVKLLDSHVICFDPQPDEKPVSARRKGVKPTIMRRSRDLKYAFDRVFNENSSQLEVFESTLKPFINSVLEGYNCTCFAYGNTGAGKTHTMLGNREQPGVMVLTIQELYAQMEADEAKKYDVELSYLEVYNESLRDLLSPSTPLPLREDNEKGMVVVGLSKHKPKNAQEVFKMLENGNAQRTQHPTDVNACSSRSHAVFQILVNQRDRAESLQSTVKSAKLLLIDLAGSERATNTTNLGERLREGANINKSLLALGNCINALVTSSKNGGEGRRCYVPYRDSKLTRLLKDALGGNCRTVMIANISPSSLWYEDTHNTLKYANRAKNIKASVTCNKTLVDKHVSQYAELVKAQEMEIHRLKMRLQLYEAESSKAEVLKSDSPASLASFDYFSALRSEIVGALQNYCSIKEQIKAIQARKLEALTARGRIMREKFSHAFSKKTLAIEKVCHGSTDRELAQLTCQLQCKHEELRSQEATLQILEDKIIKEVHNRNQQGLLLLELKGELLRLERNTPPLDICLAAVSNELQEFDKFLQALKDPGQPLPPSFPIGSLKADGFQNDSEGCRNETCPERLRVEKTHFEEAPKICGEKVPSSILRLRCSDNYKTASSDRHDAKLRKTVRFNIPEIPSFMRPTSSSKARQNRALKENILRPQSPSRVSRIYSESVLEKMLSPSRVSAKSIENLNGANLSAARVIAASGARKALSQKRVCGINRKF